jgi:UDP-N-acetylglucosamine--N-acetylmuramyl-(pentapeptide) pyrophosphoryl-undecaprenol N-acetylglucosamine transferase
MERFFRKEKIILTGNPVREEITKVSDTGKSEARKYFGIDPVKQTLLVVGGSQGAGTLNECVKKWISGRDYGNIQMIWQYGRFYRDGIMKFMEENRTDAVKEFEFIKRMDLAFSAADVIITRAGAGTISELCIAGKACIFVPSPNVAENHQAHNAMALVRSNAALMVPDHLAGEKVMKEAVSLLADPERIREMETNIAALAIKNSAELIANEVINIIQEK